MARMGHPYTVEIKSGRKHSLFWRLLWVACCWLLESKGHHKPAWVSLHHPFSSSRCWQLAATSLPAHLFLSREGEVKATDRVLSSIGESLCTIHEPHGSQCSDSNKAFPERSARDLACGCFPMISFFSLLAERDRSIPVPKESSSNTERLWYDSDAAGEHSFGYPVITRSLTLPSTITFYILSSCPHGCHLSTSYLTTTI